MSAIPHRRKGWCPGALRPMETGDGLLVRVRAVGARLSLDQAAAVADAAIACGNGVIGVSARANLQIRGVGERSLTELHARLALAGLLDSDPEIERLRNIVSSPLSDIDPDAAFGLMPCVEALEARLAGDQSLRPLPAKFGFAFDAGGRLPIGDIDADIRFEAASDARKPAFAVYLAGDDACAAICAEEDVAEAAARLARAFLSLTHKAGFEAPSRMLALVARAGAAAVFAEAGLAAAPRPASRKRTPAARALGATAFGRAAIVGIAAPFGQIDAGRLTALIARARAAGAADLRVGPWRTFFITGLPLAAAAAFAAACAQLGLITDANDARLRVAACPGAPACSHAHHPLREDAARWASFLPKGDGVLLHVSGCAKGCARAAATAATFIATEAGYDLVVDGRAGDRPIGIGLSADAVAAWLGNEGAKIFRREAPL